MGIWVYGYMGIYIKTRISLFSIGIFFIYLNFFEFFERFLFQFVGFFILIGIIYIYIAEDILVYF